MTLCFQGRERVRPTALEEEEEEEEEQELVSLPGTASASIKLPQAGHTLSSCCSEPVTSGSAVARGGG
ncbi:hypothetical protein EYF80_036055 [Liparis tanakae]|uniref:Uncharacterized protein n=1 Tax=Liparis tanakae TaxID=230148 RepID=A0A4Z2GJT1_9TELE|nr:hypothetical protein EYF80_036055 [Liparis tanakae]